MSELLARHRAVIPNWVALYYDEPIEIVSGKGNRVVDAEGKSYLDFFARHPHQHDRVRRARGARGRRAPAATGVVHTSTLYLLRGQVELAEKIARLSGIPDAKVFFTNSGTEANETALLLATYAREVRPGARHAAELPRPLLRRDRRHRQPVVEEQLAARR